ncbi:MAG: inorganic phosphate transporter, partial [Oscillospiraceae bacterium]|nr:inorganic phosphate transporter [Oscillospiraceae bacterium]
MPSLLPAALTAGVILENGGTDAPNAVSACVASGALRPRAAVAMAAAGNLIGCLAAGLFFPFVAGTTAE